MRSDVFTCTGTSHLSCQDYARSTDRIVALGDGCSSSPHTDIGSRCVVWAALEYVREVKPVKELEPEAVALYALEMICRFKAPIEALDSTLLVAEGLPDGFSILMIGDGVCGWRLRDGRIQLLKRTYKGNCPMYMRYLLGEDWNLVKGGESMTSLVLPDGTEDENPFVPNMEKEPKLFRIFVPKEEADLVFVATDGLLSFQRTTTSETSKILEVPKLSRVASKFLGFKSLAGQFVARRAKRALEELGADGFRPMDDLSMGVVLSDKEE